MVRTRGGRRAASLVAGVLLVGGMPTAAAPVSAVGTSSVTALAAATSGLRTSADLGHGEKVSRAASAPGGPVVPEGCRNFGHWVSSEARGTTCEDDPRPGRGQDKGKGTDKHKDKGSKVSGTDGSEGEGG